jgi:uncharacterized protein with HEPN domain
MKDSETRDRILIDEMLRHAEVIASVVAEGKARFTDPGNVRSRYTVEHATELIAEAAEKVSTGFKGRNSNVPWDSFRPLRKAVAHPYDIGSEPPNVDETWRFAQHDLPPIVRRLKAPHWDAELRRE